MLGSGVILTSLVTAESLPQDKNGLTSHWPSTTAAFQATLFSSRQGSRVDFIGSVQNDENSATAFSRIINVRYTLLFFRLSLTINVLLAPHRSVLTWDKLTLTLVVFSHPECSDPRRMFIIQYNTVSRERREWLPAASAWLKQS